MATALRMNSMVVDENSFKLDDISVQYILHKN